jgi:hypothetical protein
MTGSKQLSKLHNKQQQPLSSRRCRQAKGRWTSSNQSSHQ